MNQKTAVLFYEIGNGDFARDVQLEFEKAIKLCSKFNIKVPLKMSITISPAKAPGTRKRFVELRYQVNPVVINTNSLTYTGEVNDAGLLVSEGTDFMDCIQEELRFPDGRVKNVEPRPENIITLNKERTINE